MGGGDLNMKKSWHPQLLKNQERVWLEEKKALEEKKKLDQLRKERDEERQVQELQRLQEEKTGKKRVERLDWLYATPASGSGPNASEMEDYLLGKKRVDKLLIADENAKIGASHKNFIAVQNANTSRDIAAKVREDPLLAIMQQQQAAMQALRDNPLRLKELQKRTGITLESKNEKKDKKGKRKHDHDNDRQSKRRKTDSDRRRDKSRERDHRYRRSRSESYSPRAEEWYYRPSRRSRSRSPRRSDNRSSPRARYRSRSRSPRYERRHSPESPPTQRYRDKPSPRAAFRRRSPPLPSRRGYDENERAARLASMSRDAGAVENDRADRLRTLEAEERAILEAEEAERKRNARDGIQGGSFLSSQQRKAMDVSLGDKMRQGHRGHTSQRA